MHLEKVKLCPGSSLFLGKRWLAILSIASNNNNCWLTELFLKAKYLETKNNFSVALELINQVCKIDTLDYKLCMVC